MPKFHSDASDTNETLTDVRFQDMGWQRRTNNWHEGNANFIVHRIRCDIREIGEFWKAVGMWGTCRDEIVKEIRSINSVQGSSGKSSMLSGIPEKRLNAGRKRVSGCAWAVRGSIHRGTVARGALSNQAGTKTMSTTGMTGQRTGSHEPAAHASVPGIARRHPPSPPE